MSVLPAAEEATPGTLMLYNSLLDKKVPFVPAAGQASKQISWYNCGPTVHDSAHMVGRGRGRGRSGIVRNHDLSTPSHRVMRGTTSRLTLSDECWKITETRASRSLLFSFCILTSRRRQDHPACTPQGASFVRRPFLQNSGTALYRLAASTMLPPLQ